MVERATSVRTVRAEEYERLQRNFAALNDQFEAANEVLSAIGRSAGDRETRCSPPSSRVLGASAGPKPPISTSSRTASTG